MFDRESKKSLLKDLLKEIQIEDEKRETMRDERTVAINDEFKRCAGEIAYQLSVLVDKTTEKLELLKKAFSVLNKIENKTGNDYFILHKMSKKICHKTLEVQERKINESIDAIVILKFKNNGREVLEEQWKEHKKPQLRSQIKSLEDEKKYKSPLELELDLPLNIDDDYYRFIADTHAVLGDSNFEKNVDKKRKHRVNEITARINIQNLTDEDIKKNKVAFEKIELYLEALKTSGQSSTASTSQVTSTVNQIPTTTVDQVSTSVTTTSNSKAQDKTSIASTDSMSTISPIQNRRYETHIDEQYQSYFNVEKNPTTKKKTAKHHFFNDKKKQTNSNEHNQGRNDKTRKFKE